MAIRGISILEVEAGSFAEELGLKPGDRIITVNGHEVPDELALKFYLSEESVDLYVQRPQGAKKHFRIEGEDLSDLGITIEEFRTRNCNNNCLFCFVDQLPPDVRPSLKVKDDDYRLSFLHGNYITLTNLVEKDLDRIIEQRLSPLYVSIHATEPELRTRVLGRKKPDNLDKKLNRLIRGGIRIHAQIVLMPGINDGIHLRKTVFDLYRRYPGVQSVAIVPVGLSDYGTPKDRLIAVTPAYSRALINQARRWQDQFHAEIEHTFACLADEFYILGNIEIPEQPYYDDFAQIEDGIGMVRDFLDEFEMELSRHRKTRVVRRGTLATGKLFFPILKDCIQRLNRRMDWQLQVCEVENRFLGKNITVAGLLGGTDILKALKSKNLGDFVIIPNEAVSRGEGILLDNLSPKDLSDQLRKPVYPSGRTVCDFFKLFKR
jgi:putative radical SAM enzyme (TIGR03279 family)